MYANWMAGQTQPPVSRRTTDGRHTLHREGEEYQQSDGAPASARSAEPAAGLRLGGSFDAGGLFERATITSRAASDEMSPMPISSRIERLECRLDGMADHAREAVFDLGRLSVVRRQVCENPQDHGYGQDHGPGAAEEDLERS